MSIAELSQRLLPPVPWQEGPKIPWDEAEFSRRMLAEHLSQLHDGASRRGPIIARQVAWIHEQVLRARPSRILDLGCGPGLYLGALAELGHEGQGIDFSPASIAYAREQSATLPKAPSYRHEDILQAELGANWDLILLLYGEFNAFHSDDSYKLLNKCKAALAPTGRLLLEVHTLDFVRRRGAAAASWKALPQGLFCPRPHLTLEEHFYNEAQAVATTRYIVVENDGAVSRYAENLQGYSNAAYAKLFADAGFAPPLSYASLDPTNTESSQGLMVFILESGF